MQDTRQQIALRSRVRWDVEADRGSTRRLLVAQRSEVTLGLVSAVLRRGGYEVIASRHGEETARLFLSERPAMALLDADLEGIDGIETLERIRQASDRPVMMLSTHKLEATKVRALLSGADDYVGLPVSRPELLARVVALLRRAERPQTAPESAVYDDGLVHVDLAGYAVEIAGVPVTLSRLEFKLLTVLLRRPGQVIRQEELLTAVWGPRGAGESTYQVRLYVGYLRRKLAEHTGIELVETVRGVGYRWAGAQGTPSAVALAS